MSALHLLEISDRLRRQDSDEGIPSGRRPRVPSRDAQLSGSISRAVLRFARAGGDSPFLSGGPDFTAAGAVASRSANVGSVELPPAPARRCLG